jgi:cyclopropane-fatty-acyl-phospholipid synthase
MNISDVLQTVCEGEPTVRFTAYDGSSFGPRDSAYEIRLNNERGLRYLLTAVGDLGLARAYVSGDLDLLGVHPGDPYLALRALQGTTLRRPSVTEIAALVKGLGWRRFVPPQPPAQEAPAMWRRRLEGLRHSRGRDADAIEQHYDVSNSFYEKVLGPSMAYTCAVYRKPENSLEEAQAEKFDLVARKLSLEPGQRLLDVGCGWGGMARHAARHYGAEVVAVTLSQRQAAWARAAVEADGLSGQVTVLHADYRDSPGQDYDAISSIGLMEHVGVKNYGRYFTYLKGKLRDGGRLLNHSITRADNRSRALSGAFIDRYVFPDGEITGSGRIITEAQDVGLEVRHEENLREHYALTLQAWNSNLVENWDACVADVGPGTARVWGLYMAGSRMSFEENSIQLHQVLAVKTSATGDASDPLRPSWGS